MSEEQAVESARGAVLQILEEEGLPPGFPPEVMAEVEAIGPGLDDAGLVDLEGLPFVTIDGPSSRDLDQALFLRPTAEGEPGEHAVFYAIADASYFVRPGTALFAEALRRGASYYVPGRVVPMLPPELSEGLISLNPDGPRRAVVFLSFLDGEGRCLETRIIRARVRSRAKLSFPQVQRFYDGLDGSLEGLEFTKSLRALQVVGKLRMHDQETRQVIRYRRVEVDIELAHGQDALMAVVAIRGEVERYNEQLSLLCNSEGGRILSERREGYASQGVYRAHPAPPASRMAEFEALLGGLVRRHGLDELFLWRRDGELGLSEYLTSLPERGPLRRVSAAIQRQAVMTNLRSSFSEEPASHHGVGARPYARFSAPMREIVGVFVHKELMEKLGLQPPRPQSEDEQLRLRVIEAASRARELQGLLDARINRLVIDRLLSGDLSLPPGERPARRATVLGLTANKAHVQLDEPPLDLKVYRGDLETALQTRLTLTDDMAAFVDPSGAERLRVGDPVDLRVESFDSARDRWVLEIEPSSSSPTVPPPASPTPPAAPTPTLSLESSLRENLGWRLQAAGCSSRPAASGLQPPACSLRPEASGLKPPA